MCLIALAIDSHPRYALVIAANRDEFHARPAAGLHWWRTHDSAPWLLAGRDLQGGGAWMGVADNGRVGMLTNVRDPSRHRADAPSRGALVTAWLEDGGAAPRAQPHNPFNLIGGDLVSGRWWWGDDTGAAPIALHSGVHGLSNASLGTPWPKVQALTRALGDAASVHEPEALTAHLFAALADRAPAPDGVLPDTGVGLARERALSSAFIAMPGQGYGTRCSTVLLGERDGAAWRLFVRERSFDANGRATHDRQVDLSGWPGPRAERVAVRVTTIS
jgi:uncharacterized protein with NRDE domain